MIPGLQPHIELILAELEKVFTDPAVLSDFRSLFQNIYRKNYFGIAADIAALAADIIKAS